VDIEQGDVMPEASSEFVALLAQACKGDQSAQARLVEQYEAKVQMVARVLLGPALRPYLDSVDLVQSVHRSLMMGMRQDKYDISSPEKLIALALTLVRRKVARHWRRLQRQKRISGNAGDSGDIPHLLADLSSPEPDPARAAQLSDALEQLYRGLDTPDQFMLELRLSGYSTAEIAEKLGIHPVALRVRMTRLRQRLRDTGVLSEWL
jgi:RNA polymerase sigma-70 factor (ECF subfamily)